MLQGYHQEERNTHGPYSESGDKVGATDGTNAMGAVKAGLLGQADPAKSVQHITELGKVSTFEMPGQSHAAL